MKIYTRFGDSGDTQLPGGQTTRKNDSRIRVCGSLDELNAAFGIVKTWDLPEPTHHYLTRIQSELFTIGSCVACIGVETRLSIPPISENEVKRLELEIDEMNVELKPLRNFLLPGGAKAAAATHFARAVCRRGERELIDLQAEFPDEIPEDLLKYLNRLSDWCFVAARFMNHHQGVEEPLWNAND